MIRLLYFLKMVKEHSFLILPQLFLILLSLGYCQGYLRLRVWPSAEHLVAEKLRGLGRFVCLVESDHPFQLDWFFKGKRLVSGSMPRHPLWTNFSDGTGASVNLFPFFKDLSDGQYKCVATNGKDPAQSHTITVQSIAKVPFQKKDVPVLTQKPKYTGMRMYVGDNYTFHCNATSKSKLDIMWFWSKVPLQKIPVREDASDDKYRNAKLRYKLSPDNTTLQIFTFGIVKDIKFDCVLANKVGFVYAGSVVVSNSERPVTIKYVKPQIITGPKDIYVDGPEQWVEVTCNATGYPAPFYNWYFENEKFAEDYSPLSFVAMRSGTIRCHAINGGGEVNATSNLSVVPKPFHALDVKFVNSTPVSILLYIDTYYRESEWHKDIPIEYAIFDYRSWKPELKPEDPFKQRRVNLTGPEGWYYNWTGLTPWTYIDFRVRFGNKFGVGKPSYEWVRGFSDWTALHDPVRDLWAEPTSNKSFTLHWKDPVILNGPVRIYRVYFTLDPSNPLEKWYKKFADQGEHSYSFNWTNTDWEEVAPVWYWKIQLVGFVNEGPFSAIQVFRCSPGAPGYVTNVTAEVASARSIVIYWNATDEPGSGIVGHLIAYNREDKTQQEDHWAKIYTDLNSANFIILRDLHPDRVYNIRVYPRSNSHIGVPSKIITARTKEAAPTHSPINLKAIARSSTSLEVFWDPPEEENRNSQVTGYRIFYTKQQNRQPNVKEVDGSVNRLVLLGLGKYTKYMIWATHLNRLGEGPSSKKIDVFTEEDVPEGAPRSVQAFIQNSSAILVSWEPPMHMQRGGRIRGYKVIYQWQINGKQYNEDIWKDVQGYGSTSTIITQGINAELTYKLEVAAYTRAGQGPRSNPVFIRTPKDMPISPVSSIKIDYQTQTLTISWYPRTAGNSLYKITYGKSLRQYGLLTSLRTEVYNITVRELSFDNLDNGVWYCFKISARSGDPPLWSAEDMTWKKMPDAQPSGPPTYLEAVTESASTIRLAWEKPEPWKRHGQILSYTISYTTAKNDIEKWKQQNYKWRGDDDSVVHLMSNLKSNTLYHFKVRANNKEGSGPYSLDVQAKTNKEVLPIVHNLRKVEIDMTSVLIKWDDPINTLKFKDNMKFIISYSGRKAFRDSNGRIVHFSESKTTVSFSKQYRLKELKPGTSYVISVKVKTAEAGTGNAMTLNITTDVSVPHSIFPPSLKSNATSHKISLYIKGISEDKGPVSHYLLFVVVIGDDLSRFSEDVKPDDFGTGSRTRRSVNHTHLDYYISRIFQPAELPTTFDLGDGSKHKDLTNFKLQNGYYYLTFIRVYVKSPKNKFYLHRSSNFSKILRYVAPIITNDQSKVKQAESNEISSIIWIAGIVVGVVVVLTATILLLVYKRRKGVEAAMRPLRKKRGRSHQNKSQSDPLEVHRIKCATQSLMSHPPIPIEALSPHVDALKANEAMRFMLEFESIDNAGDDSKNTSEASMKPLNKVKNRYPNVLAYDTNRVKLEFNGTLCSDYINANYIDGYCQEKAYIATQGPMKNTVNDFWRLCWEQNVHVIVMMTNLEERGRNKCEQYWPKQDSIINFDCVSVEIKDSLELADFVMRTLSVKGTASGEVRFVKQFQFTSWPDPGVPENPAPVLSFIKRVRNFNPPGRGPVVVHCSAGVGRTACFVAVDAMLERIKYESMIDIYGYVAMIRAQRNFMVQTDEQYIFIHDVLVEAIESGDTEILSSELSKEFRRLTELRSQGRETLLELQFKAISIANDKALDRNLVTFAHMSANEPKNRCRTIVPFDSNRVVLQLLRSHEGSDYINASYINGYHKKQEFIASQGPMSQTVADFWRMIIEKDCSTIVMLTDVEDKGKEQCFQYWPSIKPLQYHYYIIDPVQENRFANFIVREFKITDARDSKIRNVRQYHYQNWPKGRIPASSEGMIELIGHVQKSQNKADISGPVVVHSSTGAGRTGVFIALNIALESLRTECLVDLYQTVKGLRYERPYMIQTLEQYEFCYQVTKDFLKNFDLEV